ncbi:MAG: SiaB family protein kinase [Bacteroidales bacterium]|nr:MAG: SiaB family protein kinase [Bacteroidales bacterium]
MIKYKINYGYRGIFTQPVSDGLIAFAHSIFDISEVSRKTKKRVFYILVECVQNITRHQELPEEKPLESTGIFFIQSAGEKYNISQGNIIQNEHINSLKEKLDNINNLDKEELKIYYKTALRDSVISRKGGAGLGLIEIARKSGNKIRFKFRKINDRYSFFFMDTLICDHAVPESSASMDFYGIDIIDELMQVLGENNVNLVYCSQFSGQRAFDMLDIIENLKMSRNQKYVVKKRIFSVLVEMLQNISQHGIDLEGFEGKTGILMVGTEGNSNKIITGNIIRKEEEGAMRKHLDHINDLNDNELEDLFVQKLTDDDFSNPLKNGMGLIDMRIKSGKPLVYDIIPVDDNYSFLSIQVTIDH